MRIAYTPEQERLRCELRGYFGGLMTPEIRAALAGGDGADGDYGDGQAYRQVVRQLGRDGWLALGWPQEHGGRGVSDFRREGHVLRSLRAEVDGNLGPVRVQDRAQRLAQAPADPTRRSTGS